MSYADMYLIAYCALSISMILSYSLVLTPDLSLICEKVSGPIRNDFLHLGILAIFYRLTVNPNFHVLKIKDKIKMESNMKFIWFRVGEIWHWKLKIINRSD